MKRIILSLYDKLTEYRISFPRLIDSRTEFRLKRNFLDCRKLSGERNKIAKDYWGGVISI